MQSDDELISLAETVNAPNDEPEEGIPLGLEIGKGCREIMSKTLLIPDSNLKTTGPVRGKPSDARPGDDDHLMMEIPRDTTQTRPSLTITMPDDYRSPHLTNVKMIRILGNFMMAELELVGESRTTGLVDSFKTMVVKKDKPIILEDLVMIGGKKAPRFLESITITVISGLEGNVVAMDVEIYACMEVYG